MRSAMADGPCLKAVCAIWKRPSFPSAVSVWARVSASTIPFHPIRVFSIKRQQDVATHRQADEQGLCDGKMVQQCANIVGSLIEVVVPQRGIGFAVSTQIDGDHAKLR